MPKIKDLSKEDLLGLIYHKLPTTYTNVHMCFCALCGDDYDENVEYPFEPYWYVCDKCNELLSNDDNFI